MRRLGLLVVVLTALGGAGAFTLPREASSEQRARVEAALPETAPATPRRPRRLLIFDLNVDYGGHGSIPVANTAFTLMGRRTGAFETVLSRDPAVFAKDSLAGFDAVFLNNTVGNLFTDPLLRQNLVEYVLGGGGLMGVHGTSVGFIRWNDNGQEDWPEFGEMLGGRGAAHLAQDERLVIRNEDPANPLAAHFGPQFEYTSEFFRVGGPWSRQRVRVLLSIDNEASAKLQGVEALKQFRPDNDYALAWCRQYGQGRVFYSSIAHNPEIFWDPQMLRFYLAATQFALGDLDAPTIPSGQLTPAVAAQEQLGWRLGIEAYTFHKNTLFETIDRAAELGVPYVGGLNFQKVSADIPKNLDLSLTDDELRQVRSKLNAAGVRMLTYYYQNIPGDEAGCRQVFELGRKLGIAAFMAEPKVADLPVIDRFANEYGIQVGLHNHDQKASPAYWSADAVLQACEGRSPMLGACADVGYWLRAGLDPIAELTKLKDRLVTIQMHDLDTVAAEGHDVPWGTGVGRVAEVVQTLHRLGVQPVMYGLEYSWNFTESMPEVAACVRFFGDLALRTAEQG